MKESENIVVKILKSVFFKKVSGTASKYVSNTSSLFKLLQNVLNKSKGLSSESFVEVKDKLSLLVRMVRAYGKREYTVVPIKTITRIVAVLIYFLSPIDLVPDLLPVIGLTDDVALLLWLFNALSDDIDAFKIWEKEQKTIKIG